MNKQKSILCRTRQLVAKFFFNIAHCSFSGLPARCCLLLFKAYRLFLSPLLPPACRYTPTCSQYAIEAVERHGAFRGLAMVLWRLLRCHPFSRGGYDPVK